MAMIAVRVTPEPSTILCQSGIGPAPSNVLQNTTVIPMCSFSRSTACSLGGQGFSDRLYRNNSGSGQAFFVIKQLIVDDELLVQGAMDGFPAIGAD